jgi:CheY-like chemotaxis protein
LSTLNEEILTFYGVLPRNYSCFGTPVEIGLVVDVMTHPSHRGKGLFVESGSAALSRLRRSETAGVIGFPIRNEVMPGHLKAGWKVQFEMPIYILPIGRSEVKNLKTMLIKVLSTLFEFSTRPLRFSIFKAAKNKIIETISIDALSNFYNSQKTNDLVVLDKSRNFLEWRLNRPEIEYKTFSCRSVMTHAIAITRRMDLNGLRTLAILDFESDSPSHSRRLVRHLVQYSINEKIDIIALTTNKENAKRLKLLSFGFFKSHKKFKVITRNISELGDGFTLARHLNFRMTWIDSDTV